MLQRYAILISCTAVAGCASPGLTTSSTNIALTPGLARSEVIGALGTPSGVLRERNGIECLVFREYGGSVVGNFGPGATNIRDRVAALKDGKLTQHLLVESGPYVMSQNATTVASACAQMAAAYDSHRVGETR